MAILNYADLSINGQIVAYEGSIEVTPGSLKRNYHPQVNGEMVITTDIATNMSKIVVPIRVTPENTVYFKTLYDNGDNNTITYRDRNFTRCTMEELPAAKDRELVDYVFYGNPES